MSMNSSAMTLSTPIASSPTLSTRRRRSTSRTTSALRPAVPSGFPKSTTARNKTFFFFSYEGFRNRKGATATSATVPTPEMYHGDFSKWVNAAGAQIPIYDPATTQGGPQQPHGIHARRVSRQLIPKNRFDPVAVKALAARSRAVA